jgi:hypothetical protein
LSTVISSTMIAPSVISPTAILSSIKINITSQEITEN